MYALFAIVVGFIFGPIQATAQQENTTLMDLKPESRRSINRGPAGNSDILNSSSVNTEPPHESHQRKRKEPLASTRRSSSRVGNMPGFAFRRDVDVLETQSNAVKVAKNIKPISPVDIGRGDIVSARIAQDLIGYEGAESPVRAVLTSGPYKGSWLIGNATMDKKTKNILVSFTTFKSPTLELPIQATVHSVTGELGLKGEFVSNYWNYFWAEVLASGVSGYANAMTERQRGIFGYSEIVPTPDSAAHQAVASAAGKTAERFSERAKEVPEFTILRGPTEVQVFITKGPQETN